MVNIVLARIDDRLIHGQVMTAWVKSTFGNRIIIVDDTVAKDDFIQRVLKMSAPPGIKVEVYSIDTGADILMEAPKDGEKVIVLAKYPKTLEGLVDKGVVIKELIVGGMGAAPGRKKLYRNISTSQEEKDIFSRLIQKGVEVNIRIVPDDRSTPVSKLL